MAIQRITRTPAQDIKSIIQPNTISRPTKYSNRLFKEICDLLITGSSLRQICTRDDMPSLVQFYEWLQKSPDLAKQYAHAKELQADYYADYILDVIDNAESSRDEIERAKVKVDALKWIASKLKPKRYGDKLDVTSDGERIEQPIYGGASLGDNRGKKQPIEGEVVKPKQIGKPNQ